MKFRRTETDLPGYIWNHGNLSVFHAGVILAMMTSPDKNPVYPFLTSP